MTDRYVPAVVVKSDGSSVLHFGGIMRWLKEPVRSSKIDV